MASDHGYEALVPTSTSKRLGNEAFWGLWTSPGCCYSCILLGWCSSPRPPRWEPMDCAWFGHLQSILWGPWGRGQFQPNVIFATMCWCYSKLRLEGDMFWSFPWLFRWGVLTVDVIWPLAWAQKTQSTRQCHFTSGRIACATSSKGFLSGRYWQHFEQLPLKPLHQTMFGKDFSLSISVTFTQTMWLSRQSGLSHCQYIHMHGTLYPHDSIRLVSTWNVNDNDMYFLTMWYTHSCVWHFDFHFITLTLRHCCARHGCLRPGRVHWSCVCVCAGVCVCVGWVVFQWDISLPLKIAKTWKQCTDNTWEYSCRDLHTFWLACLLGGLFCSRVLLSITVSNRFFEHHYVYIYL